MTDRDMALKELGAIDAIAVLMGNVIGEFTGAISDSISMLLHGDDAPAAEESTHNDEQASLIRRLREEITSLNEENAGLTGQLVEKTDQCEQQKQTIRSIREETSDMITDLNEDLHRAGEREAALLVKIADLEEQLRQIKSAVVLPETVTTSGFAVIEDIEEPEEPDEPETRTRGGYHKWTAEEDGWIAAHLNSATDMEVAEKFGVSQRAAYKRMCKIRDRRKNA